MNKPGSVVKFHLSSAFLRLTAYVIKVFSMASNLVETIDRGVVCNAVRFLILKAQQPDGVFVEIGEVYSESMRVCSITLKIEARQRSKGNNNFNIFV